MRHLTGYERETIINFNEAEDIAYVFTYNQAWQKHLEGKLGLKPTTDNGSGGKEYQVDKKLIRLPQPKRRLSEATKQRLLGNLGLPPGKATLVQKPQGTGKIGKAKR